MRLDQKKIGEAREAIRKMRGISAERPEDRALLDGAAGALLQVEGKFDEAESLYRAAYASLQEAGKAGTAEAATVLSSLATLYIHRGRYAEAGEALERALVIYSAVPNTAWLDLMKLLNNRAVLNARQLRWRGAEGDLRSAVAIADRESQLAPVYLATLLANYAEVLRKNHHVREARAAESRAVALRRNSASKNVIDVTEFPTRAKFLW